MNTIRFQVEEGKDVAGETQLFANIFIDDKNLIDILRKYELPFAKKEGSEEIAGSYAALLPDELFSNLTMYNGSESEQVAVLDCTCGCEGCWTFMLRVIETDDCIIWTDFEQIHRAKGSHNYWDYSNFPNFKFNKTDYLNKIQALGMFKE